MVTTVVHRFDLPLEKPAQDWQPFRAFRGPTRTFADMSCHASVLTGGHSPHPPHAHGEEELLIPLHGEMELLIAEGPSDPKPRTERLGPGSLVYYQAWQHHTIRNPGTSPVGYLMFKWNASRTGAAPSLDTSIFRYGDLTVPPGSAPMWTHRIFEGPTSCLGKLHAHLTVLQPGACYEPHVDAYDVGIVVLSGRVETVGQIVDPLSVIYYAAGELHGMRNATTEQARYLVFEFHAPGVDVAPQSLPFHRTMPGRVLRLGRRLVRPIWHGLRPYLPGLRKR